MRRGEVWFAQVGRKHRPVLVLTRDEVIDVRTMVTVAEITTQTRGLGVEVALDHASVGLDQTSVINCDGLHTIAQATLTTRVGAISNHTLDQVCSATDYALGC